MAGIGCCTSDSITKGDITAWKGKTTPGMAYKSSGSSARTGGAQSKLGGLAHLSQGNNIIAEYVWLDGGCGLRSKCRTINKKKVTNLSQIPEWNYDGSSTYQAITENSEVILKPVFYFPDPFRGGDNIMVLCETYQWADASFKELAPTNTNFRHFAKNIFDAAPAEKPWFGIEQEYTLFDK